MQKKERKKGRKEKKKKRKKKKGGKKREEKTTTSFSTDWGSFSSQHRLRYFALLLKLKDRRSAEFLAFIRPVDYTGVIFSTHLFAEKCEVFSTTSTREIQLRVWPDTG